MTRCDRCTIVPAGTWWICTACGQRYLLPQPGFQERFVSSDADIVLAASGSGPGKTAAMLLAAARYTPVAGYRGLLLRQQEKDLSRPDGLIDQARSFYEPLGGIWYAAEQTFRFTNGSDNVREWSSIQLAHVGDSYRTSFRGPAAAFLGIDEVDQIPRAAFWWFFSRLRSAAGAPIRIRLSMNPEGDSWVYDDIARHFVELDTDPSETYPRRYLSGTGDGRRVWADTPEEASRQTGRGALSVDFMSAKLSENRYLADSGMEARLALLERDDAAIFADGRWSRRSKGKMLRPAWLAKTLDEAPAGTRWVRVWDLAATDAEDAKSNSYTAGIKIGEAPDGRIIIGDGVVGQWGAADVERIVCAVAGARDPFDRDKRARHHAVRRQDGPSVPIRLCREWAGAGKHVGDRFVKVLLVGYDVSAEVESGKKTVRIRPFVAQAEAGNVYFLRFEQADVVRDHLLALPDKPDDVGDAVARGLSELAAGACAVTDEDVASDLESALDMAAVFGRVGDRVW